MRRLKRLLKMHRIFVIQDLKRITEYKADFLVGLIGFAAGQVVNILFLSIIFSRIPHLLGWEYEAVIFIYGFSLLPKALDRLLFDNIWSVGWSLMRNGDFDKYLTRPVNTLFHVITERFQLDSAGELTVGILLLCSVAGKLEISWSFMNILLFILVLPFAVLIYTSIKILAASPAFWIKRSQHIIFTFYNMNDFSKYPAKIYSRVVQTAVTYIVPFAFTAYYPSCYFLTGENPLFNIGGTVLISAVLFTLAVAVWHWGLSAYESAGS